MIDSRRIPRPTWSRTRVPLVIGAPVPQRVVHRPHDRVVHRAARRARDPDDPAHQHSLRISAVRIGIGVAPHEVPGFEWEVVPDRTGPVVERRVQGSRCRDERVTPKPRPSSRRDAVQKTTSTPSRRHRATADCRSESRTSGASGSKTQSTIVPIRMSPCADRSGTVGASRCSTEEPALPPAREQPIGPHAGPVACHQVRRVTHHPRRELALTRSAATCSSVRRALFHDRGSGTIRCLTAPRSARPAKVALTTAATGPGTRVRARHNRADRPDKNCSPRRAKRPHERARVQDPDVLRDDAEMPPAHTLEDPERGLFHVQRQADLDGLVELLSP